MSSTLSAPSFPLDAPQLEQSQGERNLGNYSRWSAAQCLGSRIESYGPNWPRIGLSACFIVGSLLLMWSLVLFFFREQVMELVCVNLGLTAIALPLLVQVVWKPATTRVHIHQEGMRVRQGFSHVIIPFDSIHRSYYSVVNRQCQGLTVATDLEMRFDYDLGDRVERSLRLNGLLRNVDRLWLFVSMYIHERLYHESLNKVLAGGTADFGTLQIDMHCIRVKRRTMNITPKLQCELVEGLGQYRISDPEQNEAFHVSVEKTANMAVALTLIQELKQGSKLM